MLQSMFLFNFLREDLQGHCKTEALEIEVNESAKRNHSLSQKERNHLNCNLTISRDIEGWKIISIFKKKIPFLGVEEV